MPKKFVGVNSKSEAARARKSAVKEAEAAKVKQKIEDEYWKDDNKQALKKQQKKDEQDKKKQEALEKKAEAKALLEKELASIKKPSKPAPTPKTTRYQIENNKTNNSQATKVEKLVVETHLDVPLEENVNRLAIDGEEARTITDAISILSTKSQDVDKHPEKRMKAAYTAFEEKRLAQLKEEQPTLRLSQLKQLIFKEWQKSPENPLNQTS